MADKRGRQPSTPSEKGSPSTVSPLKKVSRTEEGIEGTSDSKRKGYGEGTGDKKVDPASEFTDVQAMFQQIIRGQEHVRRSLESKLDKLRNELKAELDLRLKSFEDEVNLNMAVMKADIDELGRRLGVVEIAQVEAFIEEESEKVQKKGDEEPTTHKRSKLVVNKEPFDNEVTVVVTGLAGNEEDEIATKYEVEEMFEVMELDKNSIKNIKKLKSKIPGRPGIVKVELKTKEDKIQTLRAKSLLKDVQKYKRIYIRGSKSFIERTMENNIRMLLKQVPDGHLYRLTGSGKIIPKDVYRRNEYTRREDQDPQESN